MLTDEEINKIAQKVAQLLSTENTDNGNPADDNYRYAFIDGNGTEYNLADYAKYPAVIDMTDDFDGVFYQVFDPISGEPYWISSYGERKSPEDMASYLNKELCGEFKITQF